MSEQVYPPHGEVRQRRQGQLLIADLHGPWNLECIRDAVHRADPVIDDMLRDGPVGIVVVVHDSMLGTHDALTEIHDRSADRRRNVEIPVAWVAPPEIEGRDVMVNVLEDVYRGTLPMRTFSDFDSAVSWIRSVIQPAPTRARLALR